MRIIYFILLSFIINQEAIVNNIELIGMVTTTSEEIFRHSGLHPSEIFDDENFNQQYDVGENFYDNNNPKE